MYTSVSWGPECSLGDRALCCIGLDPPALWIDPARRMHFAVRAIFHSNQWSTTGPPKAAVCAVLSVVNAAYWKEYVMW